MNRDEIWEALDDLAAGDAPPTPMPIDLIGAATRLRRRRMLVRAAASATGAAVATAAVLFAPSLLTSVAPADTGRAAADASRPPHSHPAGLGIQDTTPSAPSITPPLPDTTPSVPDITPPVPDTTPSSPAGKPPTAQPSPTAPTAQPPQASQGRAIVRINAGGGAIGLFAADDDVVGGKVIDYPDRPVTTAGVRGPAPQRVYQSCRYGPRLHYRLSGLKPAGRYLVRLHWAELDFEAPHQRVFAVAVNGVTVLPQVDIVALAGARWRALVKETPATADADGAINVLLTKAGPDNPFLNALEILPVPSR